MITTAQARELAHGAVETALAAGALEAEALVFGNETALTRFANDRVHQNVANEDVQVQVRINGVAASQIFTLAAGTRYADIAVTGNGLSIPDAGVLGAVAVVFLALAVIAFERRDLAA